MSTGGQPATPDAFLDTLGLLCPLPIVETQNKVRTMETGQVLEVVSDDRGILADMPAWCKGTGHTLLDITEDADGHWHCYVRVR